MHQYRVDPGVQACRRLQTIKDLVGGGIQNGFILAYTMALVLQVLSSTLQKLCNYIDNAIDLHG